MFLFSAEIEMTFELGVSKSNQLLSRSLGHSLELNDSSMLIAFLILIQQKTMSWVHA